jgi:threonine dehydrogenase-like Zn-dependent dehydrogenase
MGARVIALDISEDRLRRAREFGADAVIDPSKTDPVAAIRDLTQGEGASLTMDTSGAGEARAQAVRATRTWGTACFVGEGGSVSLDVSPDMLRRQITIVASWTFSTVGQAECARFVAERKVDVDHLFTHRWSLDEAVQAYRLFDTQSTGKGVFLM